MNAIVRENTDYSTVRETPVDLEAEAAVLGVALNGRPEVLRGLQSHDFCEPRHRDVFETLKRMFVSGDSVDPVSVLGQMRRAGTAPTTADRGAGLWLYDLWASAATPGVAYGYRRQLVAASTRRRTMQAFQRVAQAAAGESWESFEEVARAEMGAVAGSLARVYSVET